MNKQQKNKKSQIDKKVKKPFKTYLNFLHSCPLLPNRHTNGQNIYRIYAHIGEECAQNKNQTSILIGWRKTHISPLHIANGHTDEY